MHVLDSSRLDDSTDLVSKEDILCPKAAPNPPNQGDVENAAAYLPFSTLSAGFH